MMEWLCVLTGTAILAVGGYFGLKAYGAWSLKRDEQERERLAAEWKRRAAERKGKTEGQSPDEDHEKLTLE